MRRRASRAWSRRAATAAGWAIALAVAGCGTGPARLPVDPGATFAAHLVHGGFAVDAMPRGEPTVLAPAHWLRLPGQAAFVVAAGSARGEGIWVTRPGGALVRRSIDRHAAVLGRVEPSWENNAIRLTIEPATGAPIRTGSFRREEVGGGVSVLSRNAQMNVDLPGSYRATLRAADGSPVGWIRVRLGLHQASPEMVDADFPPGVDAGVAAACVVALDAEVDWIETHTYDVYRPSLVGN
jgi:hypothetical protein